MPAQELSHRFQDAVLWPRAGYDNYGQATVHGAVDLVAAEGTGVRWVTTNAEALDPQGNTITLDAKAIVDRRIDIGSLMFLGAYDELCGTGEGNEGLMQVKTYQEAQDVKGRVVAKEVGLMRFRDSFPTIVD